MLDEIEGSPQLTALASNRVARPRSFHPRRRHYPARENCNFGKRRTICCSRPSRCVRRLRGPRRWPSELLSSSRCVVVDGNRGTGTASYPISFACTARLRKSPDRVARHLSTTPADLHNPQRPMGCSHARPQVHRLLSTGTARNPQETGRNSQLGDQGRGDADHQRRRTEGLATWVADRGPDVSVARAPTRDRPAAASCGRSRRAGRPRCAARAGRPPGSARPRRTPAAPRPS